MTELQEEHIKRMFELIKNKTSFARLQEEINNMAHEVYPFNFREFGHKDRAEYKRKLREIYGDAIPNEYKAWFIKDQPLDELLQEQTRLERKLHNINIVIQIKKVVA